MGLSVGSVCSGAGFMDLGFHRAGLRPAWFCEADAYRRRVLARHWPGVPIHTDLTELDPAELGPVDVYAGGTPCSDWSIVGNRAGFEGDRASLYWHFIRIRDAIKPEWTVWENVPGVFSQHDGRDFARVLGALVGTDIAVPSGGWTGGGVAAGPGGSAAWRMLNAQWFGVPQRRRRVFVVADLGGVRAEQVLFEREGGGRNPAESGEAGQEPSRSFGKGVAGTLGKNSGGYDPTDLERGGACSSSRRSTRPSRGGVDDNDARAGHLVAAPLTAGGHPNSNEPGRRGEDDVNLVAGTIRSHSRPGSNSFDLVTGGGGSVPREGVSRTLTGSGGRLDGETDTFVIPRDADPGEPRRCEPDAGDEYADRGADR
jgi:site-specific DNA-cytosine methylase